MATQTTTSVSSEAKIYYDSEFLTRSKAKLVHREGLQKGTHPKGNGQVIRFTRRDPFTVTGTPLSEGTNPTEASITSANVDATLGEYGLTVKISKRLSLAGIDKKGEQTSQQLGQHMGETLDFVAREALFSGATVKYPNAATTLATLTASDKLSAAQANRMYALLENANAPKFKDGKYMGKISSFCAADIKADATWVQAKTYSDVEDLYNGEIGELYGIRFLVSTQPKTEVAGASSNLTAYSCFFHGEDAAGEKDLEGDIPELVVKVPGPQDTSNPADRYSTMSWAGSYVAKALVAAWIINLKVVPTVYS